MSIHESGKRLAPLWMRWILVTALGHGLGMTLSTILDTRYLRPLGPVLWGTLNVLIYGAMIGLVMGFVQWIVLPRRRVSFGWWITLTVIGTAVGYLLAALAAENLGNAMNGLASPVLSQAITTTLGGILIGLGIGVAQGWVLRGHAINSRRWAVASGIGTGAHFWRRSHWDTLRSASQSHRAYQLD